MAHEEVALVQVSMLHQGDQEQGQDGQVRGILLGGQVAVQLVHGHHREDLEYVEKLDEHSEDESHHLQVLLEHKMGRVVNGIVCDPKVIALQV